MSLKSIWQRRAYERGFVIKTDHGDIRVVADPTMATDTIKWTQVMYGTPLRYVPGPKRSIIFVDVDKVEVV